MKRTLALLMAVVLLALPVSALAAPGEGESRMAELWDAAAAAFSDAFDAVRDPEVQETAMAALRSRWDELRAGLGANLDAIRAGVEDAGRSVGDWLEGHRADIDAVAQQAGAGLGEIVNGLNGALASVFG